MSNKSRLKIINSIAWLGFYASGDDVKGRRHGSLNSFNRYGIPDVADENVICMDENE